MKLRVSHLRQAELEGQTVRLKSHRQKIDNEIDLQVNELYLGAKAIPELGAGVPPD